METIDIDKILAGYTTYCIIETKNRLNCLLFFDFFHIKIKNSLYIMYYTVYNSVEIVYKIFISRYGTVKIKQTCDV